MKKNLFSLHISTSRLLLVITIFSFIIGSSLNAMIRFKGFAHLLSQARSTRTTSLQQRGDSFLQNLRDGTLSRTDAKELAKSFVREADQEENRARFAKMAHEVNCIVEAAKNHDQYKYPMHLFTEEFYDECLEMAQTVIDDEPFTVAVIVDCVPNIINRQIYYLHGYGMRLGTLLDNVLDEKIEETNPDRVAILTQTEQELRGRGAKTLREIMKESKKD